EILEPQRRLAEEFASALVLQNQQLTLYRSDRRLRHIAVLDGKVGRVFRDIRQHGAEILKVEDGESGLGGRREASVEHRLLDVSEVHEARQQQRSYFGNGGAHGVSLLPEQIPEHHPELVWLIVETQALGPSDQGFLGFAHLGNAGEIALDVGRKNRNARAGKALRQDLQSHSLPGPRGARNEPMAIGKGKRQNFGLETLADEDRACPIEACKDSIPSRLVIAIAALPVARSTAATATQIGLRLRARERASQNSCHALA